MKKRLFRTGYARAPETKPSTYRLSPFKDSIDEDQDQFCIAQHHQTTMQSEKNMEDQAKTIRSGLHRRIFIDSYLSIDLSGSTLSHPVPAFFLVSSGWIRVINNPRRQRRITTLGG
jgi:hypothetical protein